MAENNTIIQGDCRAVLPTLEDDCADICITSPPYNIGSSEVSGWKYKGYGDQLSQEDYFQFLDQVLCELIRTTKHYVFFNIQVLSGNKRAIFKLIGKYYDAIKELFVWNKQGTQAAIEPGVLNSAFELILVLSKNRPHKRKFDYCFFKKGCLSNVIHGENNRNDRYSRIHRAVYPEYLVKCFVTHFSREGDVVLDPFVGTGTTAVVCKQNNRYYVGIELNPLYIDVCHRRLAQETLLSANTLSLLPHTCVQT